VSSISASSSNRDAFWHSEKERDDRKDFSRAILRGAENCALGVTETEVGHSRRKGLALAYCDNGKTRNDVVGLGFRPFPGYRSTKRYEAAPRAIIGVSCVYNTHQHRAHYPRPARIIQEWNLCIAQIGLILDRLYKETNRLLINLLINISLLFEFIKLTFNDILLYSVITHFLKNNTVKLIAIQ